MRNDWKRKIRELCGESSSKTKRLLKHLRNEATKVKTAMKDKHDNKLAHINRIYGGQREKLVEIPPDIGEFKDCIAFNKNSYDNVSL